MTVSRGRLLISTPERVHSRLGALEYVDGFPSRATSELVYDHLDYMQALNVLLNGFAGTSTCRQIGSISEGRQVLSK